MSAELAARRMAAAAVVADFQRDRARFCDSGGREPDAIAWCGRLEFALESLLDQLAAETARTAHPAVEQLAAIRDVLAGFDWEYHDRQLALEAIDRIASGGQR